MEELGPVREALQSLKRRLGSGEIDAATYDQLRERVLADLTTAERAALGTATPQPTGASPHSGAPRPLGPSGASGSAVRTHVPSLSDLNLSAGTILLDQWRLEKELGRGGFGAVFAAEELHLHEKQAVKVLDPAMVAKEELLARFRREVSLMRKLVHPRIVRVYDYREDLSQLVALISMELVTGGSVKQLLALSKERTQPIPLPLAMEILGQTLEALAEAHAQGVIHRDVTPGNVLLAGGTPEQLLADPSRDPHVKLVDFGIAGLVERSELSQKSRVLGTAAYVAPEVLDPSVEVTPAADVYGAGAMAYELLTGRLPLGRFEEPRGLRSEIDKEVNDFVLTLLASRPELRPGAKAGAWGLLNLREEETKGAERRESERRAAAERAARETQQAEATRRRQAEEEAKRRQEVERRAAEERERPRAEAARVAERARGARAGGDAGPTSARKGLSPGAWGAIALAVVVVVIVGVVGVWSQRAAQERARAEAARVEQEMQAAVAAQRQRGTEAAAQRQREADAAAQRQREAEARERSEQIGTWRDERTSLLWTAKDNGSGINWDSAKSYCENLTLGGFSDWRMPSIAELEGLYDASSSKQFKTRGRVELSDWWVWSGDLKSDDSAAWIFVFLGGGGGRGWGHRADSDVIRALCVRRSRG